MWICSIRAVLQPHLSHADFGGWSDVCILTAQWGSDWVTHLATEGCFHV